MAMAAYAPRSIWPTVFRASLPRSTVQLSLTTLLTGIHSNINAYIPRYQSPHSTVLDAALIGFHWPNGMARAPATLRPTLLKLVFCRFGPAFLIRSMPWIGIFENRRPAQQLLMAIASPIDEPQSSQYL